MYLWLFFQEPVPQKARDYCLFCLGLCRGLLSWFFPWPRGLGLLLPHPQPPGLNPRGTAPVPVPAPAFPGPRGSQEASQLFEEQRGRSCASAPRPGKTSQRGRGSATLGQLCCLRSFPASASASLGPQRVWDTSSPPPSPDATRC